jgi:hypothetical protein
MSRLRDSDDTAQDRDAVNVAPEPKGMLDVSGLLDPSPPLIPRMGGQEMELESSGSKPPTPEEKDIDSPRRAIETEGGDSELTNLRGKSKLLCHFPCQADMQVELVLSTRMIILYIQPHDSSRLCYIQTPLVHHIPTNNKSLIQDKVILVRTTTIPTIQMRIHTLTSLCPCLCR